MHVINFITYDEMHSTVKELKALNTQLVDIVQRYFHKY